MLVYCQLVGFTMASNLLVVTVMVICIHGIIKMSQNHLQVFVHIVCTIDYWFGYLDHI